MIARLQAALREALIQPTVQERLSGIGMVVVASTPADFARFVAAQRDLTERLTRAARITAD